MEPQKSLVLPLALTVLVSALVFGGLGYYVANSKKASEFTSVTPATLTTPIMAVTTQSTTPTSTATADETANWKTWAYAAKSFSVKYPSNWYLTDRALNSDNSV